MSAKTHTNEDIKMIEHHLQRYEPVRYVKPGLM